MMKLCIISISKCMGDPCSDILIERVVNIENNR